MLQNHTCGLGARAFSTPRLAMRASDYNQAQCPVRGSDGYGPPRGRLTQGQIQLYRHRMPRYVKFLRHCVHIQALLQVFGY